MATRSRIPVIAALAGCFLVLAGFAIAFAGLGAVKVIAALVLILIGLGILLGPAWRNIAVKRGWSSAGPSRIRFASGTWVYDGANAPEEYSLTFGSGTLDLSQIKAGRKPAAVGLDVTFGELVVSVDDSIPVAISLGVSLAEIRLPDGRSVSGGQAEYRTRAAERSAPLLTLTGRVLFGEVRIIAKTVIKKPGLK